METFIVTGASSGIGKEIYEYLRARGSVIGISRDGPDLNVDLSDSEQTRSLAARLKANPIRCLVNCAGILRLGPGDDADGDEIFNVNFWAPYCLSMGLKDSFVEGGSIINIASVSGIMACPDTPVYGSSKAALLSLTKSLAIKWAPRIRVNAISPGFVSTNLVPGPTPQELIDPVPLGFEAETSMIIPAVRMLLECPYMTGANIVVDGGLSS